MEPNIRTNPESQAAAYELIQISHQLRKAKYLQTPRSLIWPMPTFVAGIETTDEIYQEWILSYLEELEHWGSNIKQTRELLAKVIKRQSREGRRVKVRDVMEDCEISIIV